MRPAHAAQCEPRRKRDRARALVQSHARRPTDLSSSFVGWNVDAKTLPLAKRRGRVMSKDVGGIGRSGLFVVLDLLVQAVLLGVEMRLLPGRDVAAVDVLVGAFLIVDRGFLVLELVVVAVQVAVVGIEPVVDV